jgi:MFS family permease
VPPGAPIPTHCQAIATTGEQAGRATMEQMPRSHVIAAAVALAFADSSIVVLALPEIYGTYDTTIVAVSWVITAYNVAVAVVAAGLIAGRIRPGHALTTAGLGVFALGSVGCAAAPSFGALVGARVIQGVGAACLLSGAVRLLAGDSRAAWSRAAAIGVAVGPALGGLLTELASWRSIFVVQAPVALAGVVAAARADAGGADAQQPEAAGDRIASASAAAGFALLFAGLVGALFLAVLLLVVVWAETPIVGAAVVSALAAGTIAAGYVARTAPLPRPLAALAGGWLFAAGLAGLARLPSTGLVYPAIALWFCGCGFALLNDVLHRAGPASAAPVVAAKHAGFVLGLIVLAPVLAHDLDVATRDAARAATAVVLDAPLKLQVKVPVAIDLARLVRDAPRGEVPDVRAPFTDRADDDGDVPRVRDDLVGVIEATITRAFRPSFTIAAWFAAACGVVAAAAALAADRRRDTLREGGM